MIHVDPALVSTGQTAATAPADAPSAARAVIEGQLAMLSRLADAAASRPEPSAARRPNPVPPPPGASQAAPAAPPRGPP